MKYKTMSEYSAQMLLLFSFPAFKAKKKLLLYVTTTTANTHTYISMEGVRTPPPHTHTHVHTFTQSRKQNKRTTKKHVIFVASGYRQNETNSKGNKLITVCVCQCVQ